MQKTVLKDKTWNYILKGHNPLSENITCNNQYENIF